MEPGTVVLFVGDSNVLLSARLVVRALMMNEHKDNAYVPVFVARGGAGIGQPGGYWSEMLPSVLRKVAPDVVVCNLGINDTAEPGTETGAGYAACDSKVDRLMAMLPSVPTLWTSLPCASAPSERRAGCTEVNRALRAAPARWSALTVLDWETEADAHPEYLRRGDIHLSEAGREAWVALVTEAIDDV